MEPPRRTKRPAGDGDNDVKVAAEAPRYDGAAGYEFVDDKDPDGVSSYGSGGTGFLDESGSFVERAARGGTKEEAWLGATDIDGESPGLAPTKRARKAMERQEEDEWILEGVVGSRAVFDIKKRIAGLLQPGETVPRALRRLKGDNRGGGKGMDQAARCAFDELMDASAELVGRGDLDAYTDDREAFERGAWDYEDARRRRRLARAAPPAAALPEAREDDEAGPQTAAAARDYYVDMFGDDAVDVRAGAKTAVDPSGGHAAKPDQPTAQPDGSGATTEEEAGGVAGWDYVYDPSSGYYYSGSTGHYYDAASGCYWSASTGTWFSYDVDGEASNTPAPTSECRGAALQMFG